MTITQEEGNEIAEKVLASWTAGFVKNNHSETMKGLFADKLAWSWPEGTVFISLLVYSIPYLICLYFF